MDCDHEYKTGKGEKGIQNVQIFLTYLDDSDEKISTTTNNAGRFNFKVDRIGKYKIEVSTDGVLADMRITAGKNPTIVSIPQSIKFAFQFGFVKRSRLIGYVWEDKLANDNFDGDDVYIANVNVRIRKISSNNIIETVTNTQGKYTEEVEPGEYVVTIPLEQTALEGMEQTYGNENNNADRAVVCSCGHTAIVEDAFTRMTTTTKETTSSQTTSKSTTSSSTSTIASTVSTSTTSSTVRETFCISGTIPYFHSLILFIF